MTGDCHVGICGSRGLQCPRLPGAARRSQREPTGNSTYALVSSPVAVASTVLIAVGW
jgi:hypothetical protein